MTNKPARLTDVITGVRQKRVLITGASGGIGSATAKLFAAHGAKVGIHYYRDRKNSARLEHEIHSLGGTASCFQANLIQVQACRRLIRQFIERFHGIDILINNAGAAFQADDFRILSEKAWDATLALNAKAPFFLIQQAYPAMKSQEGGKIINISSIASRYGGSSRTMHYGASKAALEALTTGFARHAAADHILVNTIRAGFIDTPFHQKIARSKIKARVQLIPLKRPGVPLDVARLALFLASDAGNFITGSVFDVSGGD